VARGGGARRWRAEVARGGGARWNRGAAGRAARFPEGAGGGVAAARRGQESSAGHRALPATPSGNLPSGRLRRNLPHPVVYPSRGTYSLVVQVICRSISTPGERKAAAVPPGNSHSMIIASGRAFHFRLPTGTADGPPAASQTRRQGVPSLLALRSTAYGYCPLQLVLDRHRFTDSPFHCQLRRRLSIGAGIRRG